MGVSKESISKFLIGNRFHVKLRIFQDWGCVILREIDFLLKICWSIPCLHPSWKVHTWIEICASWNHRKKTKADGSRLIPRKNTEKCHPLTRNARNISDFHASTLPSENVLCVAVCGCRPTVDHVLLQCPIHWPPCGLHGLTVLDDETTNGCSTSAPISSAAKQWIK